MGAISGHFESFWIIWAFCGHFDRLDPPHAGIRGRRWCEGQCWSIQSLEALKWDVGAKCVPPQGVQGDAGPKGMGGRRCLAGGRALCFALPRGTVLHVLHFAMPRRLCPSVVSRPPLCSLALSLEQSTKEDKRIIVIHNLRERATLEEMNEVRQPQCATGRQKWRLWISFARPPVISPLCILPAEEACGTVCFEWLLCFTIRWAGPTENRGHVCEHGDVHPDP